MSSVGFGPLNVEKFVQLGARRVVDLDEPRPFLRFFRPQEVQRFLDSRHLFLGTSVAPVVGDDGDDSCKSKTIVRTFTYVRAIPASFSRDNGMSFCVF